MPVDLLAQYGIGQQVAAEFREVRVFLGEQAESSLAVWLSLPISWT